MSYKTNLTLNKRQQLKAQMDDFATFQWRGHDMFDDFGCFIINDKNGSLKFYNGPGFSNQYAKPQFSKSVNGLLGVDWKQQTIPMKVGLYWFTIEEYQEFLNCINPYEINYLTFNYAPDYGYLVKLGKIADSTRHIVGRNENGDIVYYTEMDLTWELVGDTCVRSNTPYEYKRREESYTSDCYTWEFDNAKSDMKDDSLLDTGVIFEMPLEFNKNTANLSFQAIYETENEDKYVNLFEINLENLTYSGNNDSPDVPNEPGDDTITYAIEWVVDGTVVFRESVIEGGSVTIPLGLQAPNGYVIAGWTPNTFTNIQSNMIFTAVLQQTNPDIDPSNLTGTVWKIKSTPEEPPITDRRINILSNNEQFEYIIFNVKQIQYVNSNAEFITATATNEYSTFTILGGDDLEKEQTIEFLYAIADPISVPEPVKQGDWLILPSSEITIPANGVSIQYGGTAYKGNGESSVFSGILLYGSVGSRKWAFNINSTPSLIYDESTGKTGEWLSFKFSEPDNLTSEHIVSLKHFAKNDQYPDTPDEPDIPVTPDDPYNLIGTVWKVTTPHITGEITGINFTSNGESFVGIQCASDREGITTSFKREDGSYVTVYSPVAGDVVAKYEQFTITGGSQLNNAAILDFLETMADQITDEPDPEPDTPVEPTTKYTVNFYNYNGEVILLNEDENNQFEPGSKVSPPKDVRVLPEDNTHVRLLGWSTDEYKNVESNLEIYPILEYGHKRTLNTSLIYVADYIPLEFVCRDKTYTSIAAIKDDNGNLECYRFVGETGSVLVSDVDVLLGTYATIYVFDEYAALTNETQLWLSKNTKLATGERLIGPSIVNDFGYYGGPGKYSIYKVSSSWTIFDNTVESAWSIQDIQNAVYCPCQYENKIYTHWTKIKSYSDETKDYLVLMNFTDKSICAIETDVNVPRVLKVSFDDSNNTTQYVVYESAVTPPNYITEWTQIVNGWSSSNNQSIDSIKAHTRFEPILQEGTVYILSDMSLLTNNTYTDILYSYQIDGVAKYSNMMQSEHYPNSYQLLYSRDDQLYYRNLEGEGSPEWMIDNQLICVFSSTSSFNTFLSKSAEPQIATMSLRMMSPRSVTDTTDSSGVSTDNTSYNPIMRLTLRYDSESGLLYVQEGANTTWHLLNYQTDNNNGDYILKSSVVKKWRIPGKFSNPSLQSTKWIFQLKSKQIKALNEEDVKTAITVYARKNIV